MGVLGYVMKPNVQGRYTMDQVVAGLSLAHDGHSVKLANAFDGDAELSPSDAQLHLPDFLKAELDAAKDSLLHPFNPLLYTEEPITRLNYHDIATAVRPHVERAISTFRKVRDARGSWRRFAVVPGLQLAIFDEPPEPIQKWAARDDPLVMATATRHHGSWVFRMKPGFRGVVPWTQRGFDNLSEGYELLIAKAEAHYNPWATLITRLLGWVAFIG